MAEVTFVTPTYAGDLSRFAFLRESMDLVGISIPHIAVVDTEDVPSFAAIANRSATTAQSLRKFLLTTHATLKTPSNMPNPQLTDDQATAVVSYILSLKKRD